jgi:hypothetical protein
MSKKKRDKSEWMSELKMEKVMKKILNMIPTISKLYFPIGLGTARK